MSSGSAFMAGFAQALSYHRQQSIENDQRQQQLNLEAQKVGLQGEETKARTEYLGKLGDAATARAQNTADPTLKYVTALNSIQTRLVQLRNQDAKDIDPATGARRASEIQNYEGLESVLWNKVIAGQLGHGQMSQGLPAGVPGGQNPSDVASGEDPDAAQGDEADVPGGGTQPGVGGGAQPGQPSGAQSQMPPGQTLSMRSSQGQGPLQQPAFIPPGAGSSSTKAKGSPAPMPEAGAGPPPMVSHAPNLAFSPEKAKSFKAVSDDLHALTEAQETQTGLDSSFMNSQIPLQTYDKFRPTGKLDSDGNPVQAREGIQFKKPDGTDLTLQDLMQSPSTLGDSLEAIMNYQDGVAGYRNPQLLDAWERDVLNKVPQGVITQVEADGSTYLAQQRALRDQAAQLRGVVAQIRGVPGLPQGTPGAQAAVEGDFFENAKRFMAGQGPYNAESGDYVLGSIGKSSGATPEQQRELLTKQLKEAIDKGEIRPDDPRQKQILDQLGEYAAKRDDTELIKAIQSAGGIPRTKGQKFGAYLEEQTGLIGKQYQNVFNAGKEAVERAVTQPTKPYGGMPPPREKTSKDYEPPPPRPNFGTGVTGKAEGGGPFGLRTASTLAAMAAGGKSPGQVFGAIGPGTPNKTAAAEKAIDEVSGMSKTDKAQALDKWGSGARSAWVSRGVDKDKVESMDRALGYKPGETTSSGGASGEPDLSFMKPKAKEEATPQKNAGAGGPFGLRTAATLASLGSGSGAHQSKLPKEGTDTLVEGLKAVSQEEDTGDRNEKTDQVLDTLDAQIEKDPEIKQELAKQWAAWREDHLQLTDRSLVRQIDKKLGTDISEPASDSEALFPGKKADESNFEYDVEKLAHPKKVEMSEKGLAAYRLVEGMAKARQSPRARQANLEDLKEDLPRMEQPEIVSLLVRWRERNNKLSRSERDDYEDVGRTLYKYLER